MQPRLLPLLALAAVPAPGQSPSHKLDLDLLLEWESVSDPQLSPDASQVLFVREWTDKVADRTRRSLWLVGADGARPRHLVDGAGAEWSPSGDRIAYLAEGAPGGAQVWVLWVDTREATQLTHVVEAPSDLAWSPDGARLAFTMQVPEKAGFAIDMPKPPKGAKWAPEPTVITRLAYRRDRSGYRPAGYRHVFVVDATEGGTPRQVTSGDYDHGAPQWSGDGEQLVFSGLRVDDADWQVRESELYAVRVDSGEVRALTSRKGPDYAPRVSPDGRLVAWLGHDDADDTYFVPDVHVMPLSGGEPKVLTAGLDRRPGQLHWGRGSDELFFTVQTEGTTQVWRADLDGNCAPQTAGAQQVSLGGVAQDGTLVATIARAHEPGDVWLLPRGAEPRRLTRVHADLLDRVTLGEVEEVRCTSSDGLPVQGWLVKPPDFDPARKYPLILQIHGGPHAMYGVHFDFERQNHAAHGYLVLYGNPRGSVGYGKEFGNAIENAYPGKDYDDLMALVDAAIARGCVDERELFVYGGSGGGVLTCWIVGSTDRFRAAVSMFPVTNWISFVGTTDGPYWYHNFAALPWDDIREHWQRSPLRLVGNVKTPTMLITGELDLRTPMAQTEEYYQALKLRKVDTVMVRVPDEYHGAAGRHVSNRLRRILYVRTWFERHRLPADGGPAEAASGR